jgi:lipid A disaccharide synthetase
MPVRANVYCTIGEMNTGLEMALQGLETLVKIKYLSLDGLRGILTQLSHLRAQVNREMIAVLTGRESANVKHFEQLLP